MQSRSSLIRGREPKNQEGWHALPSFFSCSSRKALASKDARAFYDAKASVIFQMLIKYIVKACLIVYDEVEKC
jgi:hypothetical protein